MASNGPLWPAGSPKAKLKLHPVMWYVPLRGKQNSLTDSEEETIVLAAEPNQLVTGTPSGQSYLKKYDEMVATPPKPAMESAKASTKQPVERQKSFSFSKFS